MRRTVTPGHDSGFSAVESVITESSMLHRPALLILLVLAAGCSAGPTPPVLSSENGGVRVVLPGLEQRVTLTPAEPIVGENVVIHSVITNRSNQPIDLESRICGLTLAGDLRLEWPPGLFACRGFSMSGSIAAGQSRESSEIKRVASGPGTYTLRVLHAVRPEVWVEMRVTVRAR